MLANGTCRHPRFLQVLSVTVDETTIIPYILKSINNAELAIKIASRNNLPGADDIYATRFQQLFQQGNFSEAAKVAANSPRVYKNGAVISRFLPPSLFLPRHPYRASCARRRRLNASRWCRWRPVSYRPFCSTLAFFSRRVNSTSTSHWSSLARYCFRDASSCLRSGSRRRSWSAVKSSATLSSSMTRRLRFRSTCAPMFRIRLVAV